MEDSVAHEGEDFDSIPFSCLTMFQCHRCLALLIAIFSDNRQREGFGISSLYSWTGSVRVDQEKYLNRAPANPMCIQL